MKKLFGEGGIKGFLALHVEKLVFAIVGIVGAFLIFSGFSNREGIRSDYDPSTLAQKVNEAQQNINRSEWSDYREERATEVNFRQRAEDARQEINTTSFRIDQALKPPYQPPRTMRTDPNIFAAVDMQVRSGFAAISKMDRQSMDGERSDSDIFDQPGGVNNPYGNEVRTADAVDDPDTRPIPQTGNTNIASRESPGRGGSMGGTKQGKYFVAVTALIPYRQQLQEFNDHLGNSRGYDPSRDMPNYFNWILYRSEVVNGKPAKWKAVANKTVMAKTVQEWGVAMTSGLGGGSLVDPQVTDPGLTMPLLQFENMSDDELDDLMRHQKIERYEFDPMQRGPMGESGAFGTEDEEVVVDEETGLDMTPQATTLGGSYRGGEGMMMPEGGRGGEGMGMYSEGGYGGGGYGGEGFGGEGGYGAREGMGPMMGEGGAYGQMASFGPGQLPDPEDFPEYKMFRYIDLNVRPNVTYQYKLELLLEDPNDPNPTRGAAAPPASSLDFAVVDRLKSRPEPPKWVASMGLDRIFYRETEASEPSKAVKVTDGRQLIVG